jgi:hypothetical protein
MVTLLAVIAAVDLTIGVVHFRGLRPPLAISLFYTAWGAIVLVGIWRKSARAWRFGWLVAAIVGTFQAFGAVFFLLLSFEHPKWECLPVSAWHLFASIFMYTIFYLLRRPASISYFKGDEEVKRVEEDA